MSIYVQMYQYLYSLLNGSARKCLSDSGLRARSRAKICYKANRHYDSQDLLTAFIFATLPLYLSLIDTQKHMHTEHAQLVGA